VVPEKGRSQCQSNYGGEARQGRQRPASGECRRAAEQSAGRTPRARRLATRAPRRGVARDKGRSKDQPATDTGGSNLKPFNPTADTKGAGESACGEIYSGAARGPVAVDCRRKIVPTSNVRPRQRSSRSKIAAQQEEFPPSPDPGTKRASPRASLRPSSRRTKARIRPRKRANFPPQGKGQFQPQEKGRESAARKRAVPASGKGTVSHRKARGSPSPKGNRKQFEKQATQPTGPAKPGSGQKPQGKDAKGKDDKDKDKN